MLGAAVSAMLLMRVMTAMRYAESAGIAAVAGGISEATLAIAIALYLGIFVGVIGLVVMVVRSLIKTSTASPSGWFFLITGGLSVIPLGILWEAESLLIQAITSRVGVVQVAATIQYADVDYGRSLRSDPAGCFAGASAGGLESQSSLCACVGSGAAGISADWDGGGFSDSLVVALSGKAEGTLLTRHSSSLDCASTCASAASSCAR